MTASACAADAAGVQGGGGGDRPGGSVGLVTPGPRGPGVDKVPPGASKDGGPAGEHGAAPDLAVAVAVAPADLGGGVGTQSPDGAASTDGAKSAGRTPRTGGCYKSKGDPCKTDGDCHVAGCGKSECGDKDDNLPGPCGDGCTTPTDAKCGCVGSMCVWFN